MSLWDRATFEERYAACCVLLAVLWLALENIQRERRDREKHQQRDSVTLQEEALEHLERGGSLEVPRWHGGDDLELIGRASTAAATSGQAVDGDDQEASADEEE